MIPPGAGLVRVEPSFEVVAAVAVAVHQEGIEKPAAIGMRLANSLPGDLRVAVPIAGVLQIEAAEQVDRRGQMLGLLDRVTYRRRA